MRFAGLGRYNAGSSPLARGTPGPPGVGRRADRFIPARAGNTRGGTGSRPGWTVHPRSRGEHGTVRLQSGRIAGSSPLARGTRYPPRRGIPRRRFIPARAGNTSRAVPRVAAASGSSPLARGTPGVRTLKVLIVRFIPARAGNTSPAWRGSSIPPVHPRSRGEHHVSPHPTPESNGSSPLARGTPSPGPTPRTARRFIPARAGNTPARELWPAMPTVHPRSRREHRFSTVFAVSANGSSPLARGTHDTRPIAELGVRFIPARAGNTIRNSRRAPSPPVHPRSRGEHGRSAGGDAIRHGSSPLARGTPGRAGSSPASPTVHPRSRGEHARGLGLAWASLGSSPLARGTPNEGVEGLGRHRFIPARAGNTP